MSVSDSGLGRPDNGQKLVLILVAAGLVIILAATLVYRFSSGGLVTLTEIGGVSLARPGTSPSTTAPTLPPDQMPGPMTGEIPQAMLDALAAQGMTLSDLGMMEGAPTAPSASTEPDLSMTPIGAEDVDRVLELAEMFTGLGDFVNAQIFVNQALVASPSDPRPYYQQGRIYNAQGQYERAVEMMERSLALGDSAQVRHDLAQVYATGLADKAKAAEQLRAAIDMPGLDPDLRAHYQEELQALGVE